MLKGLAAALVLSTVTVTAYAGYTGYFDRKAASADERGAAKIDLTITSSTGSHHFLVEVAKTQQEQQRGLMYRTDLKPNQGMLFAPYPPSGPPREASFWMKNTPTPLDIIFIRADGTIATIAENTVPFSETPVPSGEPVAAVLELIGGRSAELGIAAGDKVAWPGQVKSDVSLLEKHAQPTARLVALADVVHGPNIATSGDRSIGTGPAVIEALSAMILHRARPDATAVARAASNG